MATLLVACILAAGWVRSCSTLDFLYLPGLRSEWDWVIVSGDQKFYVLPAVDLGALTDSYRDDTKIFLTNELFELKGWYHLHSLAVTKVTGIFESVFAKVPKTELIPYWTAVLPLTLLSIWLLLSKVRAAKPSASPRP